MAQRRQNHDAASARDGDGAALQELAPDALGAVGTKIRDLRVARKMSLRALGAKCGLSVSFLSMVERGQSSLALTSLQRIAAALDTSIPELFSASLAAPRSRTEPHVRRGDDPHDMAITGARRTYILLSGRSPDRVLEPMLMIVQPSEALEEPYGHEGEEFLYVLEGELTYLIDGEEQRLCTGDSIHLCSDVPHTIFNGGDETAKAILVVTPRFF